LEANFDIMVCISRFAPIFGQAAIPATIWGVTYYFLLVWSYNQERKGITKMLKTAVVLRPFPQTS
jgi:hypothetical protein